MICNQEPRHYKHSFDVWFHFFFPDVLFASPFLPNDASFPNSQALSLIFSQLFFFAFLNQNSFWVLSLLWAFSKRLKDLAKSFVGKLIAINFSLFVLYSICWFPFFVRNRRSLTCFLQVSFSFADWISGLTKSPSFTTYWFTVRDIVHVNYWIHCQYTDCDFSFLLSLIICVYNYVFQQLALMFTLCWSI